MYFICKAVDMAPQPIRCLWSGDNNKRKKKKKRAFAHGVMGRRIDPSWGGPIELFLVPESAPRLV